MVKNKDQFQVNNYEFSYVERPELDISDSYGLAKEPLDGDTSVDGWENLVGDIDENYSLIQQNEDNINLRVKKDDVINQINISDEGILIDGSNIEIDGTTTFSSGYDPSEKLDSADVGDLAFQDLVEEAQLGTTIIDGGYIKTDLLTADNIATGTLEGIKVIQDNGSGESITLTGSSGTPKIEFEDDGYNVGYLAGDNNYSITIAGASFTIDGIRTSGSFLCGTDLVVEDDLIVNDDVYIDGTMYIDGDIDLRDYDLDNVDNLYVKDIYGNGVSTIDVNENLDMNGYSISNQGNPSFEGAMTNSDSSLSYQTSLQVRVNGTLYYIGLYN